MPVQSNDTQPTFSPSQRRSRQAGVASVLVVDDEKHILDFLTNLLEDEGYRVYRAMNAREALLVVRQHAPRLVISDVTMPVHSGVDLYQWLMAEEVSPRMVFMSARSRRSPLTKVPFLEKPFDIDDLLEVVSVELARGS